MGGAAAKFLSTLSLRRATACNGNGPFAGFISIHALLAESDNGVFITDKYGYISIHALLAESDLQFQALEHREAKFLSTLSLRRATWFNRGETSLDSYFYPRSPCGERRDRYETDYCKKQFLSTLSLRRATVLRRLLG